MLRGSGGGMTAQTNARSQELTLPVAFATPVVFVIDDDVSVRDSLQLLIRSAGWQPETFVSAEDFLDRPRIFTPSCLVLDVFLPGLSGLDLQQRIADRNDMP